MTDTITLFKALSDGARLRIVALLSDAGELCVCDIEKVLGFSQPKVSRHLSYLKRAGLVRSRRHGVWMYYALVAQEDHKRRQLLEVLLSMTASEQSVQQDRRQLQEVLCTPC
ncbi:MAG: metalloregulator ArsR/SmtB family transcription factor [Bacteroidetes bacterium]|nr:metalloregulator ArsR/SmtB family transcription factor [Bacteroidota bacterium]